MKRMILASVLMLAITATFAFTSSSPETSRSYKAFKRYTVVVSQNVPIQGSPCTVTISIMFQFDWNGPLTPITNLTVFSTPAATLHCPSMSAEVRQTSLTGYQFDTQTGHFTDVDFAATGHTVIDSKLADATVLQLIMDEINDQIDGQ